MWDIQLIKDVEKLTLKVVRKNAIIPALVKHIFGK